MGSVLYLRTMPEVGGDTLFANMAAAFATLSKPMRQMLAGLYRGRHGTDDRGRVRPPARRPFGRAQCARLGLSCTGLPRRSRLAMTANHATARLPPSLAGGFY
jgi:hypothetical protein